MKNFLIFSLLAAGLVIGPGFFPAVVSASDSVPAPPVKLDFSLPAPASVQDRAYLGLENQDPFTIGQVNADIVIIQIFSMYCPICQREAGDVNIMFDRVQADPGMKNRIRFIGIGAGNSDFEVAFYKENYQVEFPLFSDGDYAIHKQINEVGTPHFFGLKMTGGRAFKIFYSRSGEIEDPEKFLSTLIRLAGQE